MSWSVLVLILLCGANVGFGVSSGLWISWTAAVISGLCAIAIQIREAK